MVETQQSSSEYSSTKATKKGFFFGLMDVPVGSNIITVSVRVDGCHQASALLSLSYCLPVWLL